MTGNPKIRQRLHQRWESSRPFIPEQAEHLATHHFWETLLQNPDEPLHQELAEVPENVGPLYEAFLSDARAEGKFYTPLALADYLTRRTLGKHLEDKTARIATALSQQAIELARQKVEQVRGLRIVDPSCGCGIFLLAALRCLHAFYAKLPDRFSDLRPTAAEIVTQQLFGVDTDQTAILLARWSLAQEASRLDSAPPLTTAQACSIFHDNALSFQWAPQSFDFVLGNPPYLSEVRQQAQRFRHLREHSLLSQYYRAKMDLCDAFVYLGGELLKDGGELGYVLPEYWLQRHSARPLREHLWQHSEIREIHTFGDKKLFKSAPGHHSSLLIFSKERFSGDSNSRSCLLGTGDLKRPAPGRLQLEASSGRLLLGQAPIMDILEQLATYPPLFETGHIQQGIVFPQTRLRESDWRRLPEISRTQCPPGTGIFVLTSEECDAFNLPPKERNCLRPYYEPKGFQAFQGFQRPEATQGRGPRQYWVIYADQQLKAALSENPEEYPTLSAHLRRFEPILTSAHKPYGLHRARQPRWFESPDKILGLRQTFQPAFATVNTPAYVSEGFYILLPDPAYPPAYYVGLLNSSLAHFWFFQQKRKGNRLQIDKDVLLSFPAPPKDAAIIPKVIALTQALATAPNEALTQELNQCVMTLYNLPGQAQHLIEAFRTKQRSY